MHHERYADAELSRGWRRVYALGPVICAMTAALHGGLMVAFFVVGVDAMGWYNVVATPFWLSLILLHRRHRFALWIALASIEVVIHQILATHYLGTEAAFHFYLPTVPVALSLLPGRHPGKVLGALVGAAIFVAADIYFSGRTPAFVADRSLVLGIRWFNIAGVVLLLVSYATVFHRAAEQLDHALVDEHARAERLLLNVLPLQIASRLKGGEEEIADAHDDASVLFVDLVGFTQLAARLPAGRIVAILNELFSRFDERAEYYGLEKIKTIGDAYMVAAGIPEPREDHAATLLKFALELPSITLEVAHIHGEHIGIRAGIHSGPVIAGVIGRNKFAYDIWGDTVNTASRMESSGVEGAVQITESVKQKLPADCALEDRGMVAIKGKGEIRAYLVRPPAAA